MTTVDPITTEVIRNRLLSVSNEMATNLMRTSYNTVVYEIKDFGVGVYDIEGRELAEAPGITIFPVAKWNAGGDFPSLMRSVSRIIRERVKLRMFIRGQLSGARAAAVFVAFMPYLILPALMMVIPAHPALKGDRTCLPEVPGRRSDRRLCPARVLRGGSRQRSVGSKLWRGLLRRSAG